MTEAAHRDPVWFRSLYWRIALGSMAVLAALLLVQAVVFLWMSGTIATTLLGQSPDHIAAEAAKDVAEALKKDPAVDIEKFVRDRYGSLTQPLMVVLEDGRAVRNHELPPPDGMRRWPGRPPGMGARGGMDGGGTPPEGVLARWRRTGYGSSWKRGTGRRTSRRRACRRHAAVRPANGRRP